MIVTKNKQTNSKYHCLNITLAIIIIDNLMIMAQKLADIFLLHIAHCVLICMKKHADTFDDVKYASPNNNN